MNPLRNNVGARRLLPAFLPLLLVLASPAPLHGRSITYDRQKNVIHVVGYPEHSPADMDSLLGWDASAKAGKVAYDPASDTYTVDASLWIGDETAPETFFRMGRKDHLSETVIVRGDVWVRPSKVVYEQRNIVLKRSDGRLPFINRLTIGDPDDASIQPVLKIACDKSGQYGVLVGFRQKNEYKIRGELHVYNGTITAATQDKAHMLKSSRWYGSDIRLINARISRINGLMTYGIGAQNAEVRGTTFEHGGYALCNGNQLAVDCTFRNLAAAVADYGSLDATLVNCSFQNNEHNWFLSGSSSRGVRMINCRLGPQKKPILIRKNNTTAEQLKRRVCKTIYPDFEELDSLVIKVVDTDGKAIPGAIVGVECADDPEAVANGLTATDENGMTPSDPLNGAILITRRKLRATDIPNQPEETANFSYVASVQARGCVEKKVPFQPGTVGRPLVVTLRRTTGAGGTSQSASLHPPVAKAPSGRHRRPAMSHGDSGVRRTR